MASRELRIRVVELEGPEVGQNSENEMQDAQVEVFEESCEELLGHKELGTGSIYSAVEKVVVEADPGTAYAENQATPSHHALRDFIANAFSSLQSQLSQKIESNNAKLVESQAKLREEIQSGNEKLI
jgi:hypothetical protein